MFLRAPVPLNSPQPLRISLAVPAPCAWPFQPRNPKSSYASSTSISFFAGTRSGEITCSGNKYLPVATPSAAGSIVPSVAAVVLDQSQPAPRVAASTRTGMPTLPPSPPPAPPPPLTYNSAVTLYFARQPYSIIQVGSYSGPGASCGKPSQPIQFLVGVADSVHLSFTPPFTVK